MHFKELRFVDIYEDLHFTINLRDIFSDKVVALNNLIKKCHYYNNNLICPFNEMGCMFLHEDSVMCKFDEQCTKNLCSYKHRKVIKKKTVANTFRDEYDESKIETSSFQTSTPKKRDDKCEDCANESECVECIVKRVRGGHGGVTTALRTPALGCSELGSASRSISDCSGGASSS